MPTDEKLNRVFNARQRLRKRPRDVPLSAIADKYDIGWHWLKLFHAGKHPNPHTRILVKLEQALDDIAAGRFV